MDLVDHLEELNAVVHSVNVFIQTSLLPMPILSSHQDGEEGII
jgi:hypothetical protein